MNKQERRSYIRIVKALEFLGLNSITIEEAKEKLKKNERKRT